jgi:hypothetical protein
VGGALEASLSVCWQDRARGCPLESLQDAAELSTELHISVHPHAAFCWLVGDHAMLLLRCGLSFYR